MKKVVKRVEPNSLTTYRSSISSSRLNDTNIYEDFKYKTTSGCNENESENLRKQLLNEQGYICCYCMSRIDCKSSKIEHFKSQTKHRNLQIDYKNLFIACRGGEGKKGKEQFCDTQKGEQELNYINLLNNIEDGINYTKYGKTILIESVDKNIDKEITEILNLNLNILGRNRMEMHGNVLRKLKDVGWSVSNINKVINYYKIKHDDRFEPYCEMIVYFLSKKLKSKGVRA